MFIILDNQPDLPADPRIKLRRCGIWVPEPLSRPFRIPAKCGVYPGDRTPLERTLQAHSSPGVRMVTCVGGEPQGLRDLRAIHTILRTAGYSRLWKTAREIEAQQQNQIDVITTGRILSVRCNGGDYSHKPVLYCLSSVPDCCLCKGN